MEADGDCEGLSLALGDCDALGLTLGLTEAEGETLALGLILGDSLLDGDVEALGETDGLSLADGLVLADGDWLGDSLALGLWLADGLTLALSLEDGDWEADGLTEGDTLGLAPAWSNDRWASVELPSSTTPLSTTRRIPELKVSVVATFRLGQLAALRTVPSVSANWAEPVLIGPRVRRAVASSRISM